jgi:hypothetical protein
MLVRLVWIKAIHSVVTRWIFTILVSTYVTEHTTAGVITLVYTHVYSWSV